MSKEKNTADNAKLIKEIQKIIVTKLESTNAIIHNPTDLPVVKLGEKNAVIGIDATRCALFFEEEADAENEYQSLLKGAHLGITPKVYGRRGTYVVMERIEAPTLAAYLEKHPITAEMTKKLLQLLRDFEKAGYTRSDHDPESIHVMGDGSLKVVNVRRHAKPVRKPFPKRLIRGMGKQVTTFLSQVKKLNPSLHQAWANHLEYEETVLKAKLGNRK